MVPFAGWEMPVQYTGVIEEHRAVRSSAGIFDLSHMGARFGDPPLDAEVAASTRALDLGYLEAIAGRRFGVDQHERAVEAPRAQPPGQPRRITDRSVEDHGVKRGDALVDFLRPRDPRRGEALRLELLGEHAVVAGPHVYRGGRRGREVEEALVQLSSTEARWQSAVATRDAARQLMDAQRKLDGHRCIAVVENGIVRMYALVLALGIGGLILYLLVRGA